MEATLNNKPKATTKSYATWLEPYDCPYAENEPFLHIGHMDYHNRWLLYISCNVYQTEELIRAILPVLARNQVPFRIPINTNHHHEINAGEYGSYLTGCTVTIFTRSAGEASQLARELLPLTHGICGITIPGAMQLGDVVFANFSQVIAKGRKKGQVRIMNPVSHPFDMPVRYPAKRPRLLAKRYVPVYIYNNRPKGDIYKAVDVRRLAFSWCFIKQGRRYASLDEQGRSMRDRLLWQKSVLQDLHAWPHAPKYLDYFEDGMDTYLVTELVTGETLFQKVRDLLKKKQFRELEKPDQRELLNLYFRVTELVGQLHELGYVHRDITDSNFIVGRDGLVSVIDFELAYSTKGQLPGIPFCYGTEGYLSPEQAKGQTPTVYEDIYSLGSLLIFVLTGRRPDKFILQHGKETLVQLQEMCGNTELVNLVRSCRSKEAARRPTILDIKATVMSQVRQAITISQHMQTQQLQTSW